MEKPLLLKTETELPPNTPLHDAFSSALREYFYIQNPHKRKDGPDAEKEVRMFVHESNIEPLYVYYPWLQHAVRIPPEEIYFALRTARNKKLITEDEQQAYRNFIVGVAGLSVGSSVVSVLARTGGPKYMKIIDADTIELTNLNRIEADLLDVGKNKARACAEKIWHLDPFANIEYTETPLDHDNVSSFLGGATPLDIFVDEMDTLEMKIEARKLCREKRIPVVMGTDNGDGVIIDVERFDLEEDQPLFHGRLTERELEGVDQENFTQFAMKVIDPVYMTERQQDSILALGSEVAGIAQLGSAAKIAGVGVAFVIRQIACKKNMPSGRYVLSCEESCIAHYSDAEAVKQRGEKTKAFAAKFGITI